MSSPNWGGKRSGSGRRRKTFTLSTDAVKSLSVLTKQKRLLMPDVTEQQVLEALIDTAWHELDQQFRQKQG